MWDLLRKAVGLDADAAPGSGVVRPAQLAQWVAAQGWHMGDAAGAQGFAVQGQFDGLPWRLECGAPTRDYVVGAELRMRMELPVHTEVDAMVINRTLKHELDGRAYGAITHSLQTTVSEDLPAELRWLAIHEDLAWPQLPASFRQCFAVVGSRLEHARLWVGAAVVAQFMREGQAAAPGGAPLVLMLSEGRLTLRMQTVACHLPDLSYATALFLMAAQAAVHQLPAPQAKVPPARPQ